MISTTAGELVEQVAAEAHLSLNPARPWDGVHDNGKEEWRKVARAAIEATGISSLQKEIDALTTRDELVREKLFVLSDRLRRAGALDSDDVHAAYEALVAALSNTGGHNG